MLSVYDLGTNMKNINTLRECFKLLPCNLVHLKLDLSTNRLGRN